MRFFEIAGPAPRDIVSTIDFDKELRFFMVSYPACLDKLKAFLEFRLQARPDQSFNSKDYPYKPGTPLAGWRHVHLIFGKVLVSYDLKDHQIRLCAVTAHDNPEKAFAQFLHNLRPEDFHPFVMPRAKDHVEVETKAFGDAETQEVIGLFYEMSAQDREILKAAVKGDLTDLMEFVDLLIENDWSRQEKQAALLAAFGGPAGLAKAIAEVLKSTAMA